MHKSIQNGKRRLAAPTHIQSEEKRVTPRFVVRRDPFHLMPDGSSGYLVTSGLLAIGAVVCVGPLVVIPIAVIVAFVPDRFENRRGTGSDRRTNQSTFATSGNSANAGPGKSSTHNRNGRPMAIPKTASVLGSRRGGQQQQGKDGRQRQGQGSDIGFECFHKGKSSCQEFLSWFISGLLSLLIKIKAFIVPEKQRAPH